MNKQINRWEWKIPLRICVNLNIFSTRKRHTTSVGGNCVDVYKINTEEDYKVVCWFSQINVGLCQLTLTVGFLYVRESLRLVPCKSSELLLISDPLLGISVLRIIYLYTSRHLACEVKWTHLILLEEPASESPCEFKLAL